MKLKKTLMTKNPCYKAGKTIKVNGLMLHSTGCPQPRASVYISSWNSPEHKTSCVHGFIDGNDGTVYQTLPWNYRGWHCGSSKKGSANNTHIGVEMCEPSCITYVGGAKFKCSDIVTARAVVKRTYESAVELFARLCKEFQLDPLADGVIISHKEGHGRGIASNHGDPEHLWSQLGTGYTMDTFRKAVKENMRGVSDSKVSVLKDTENTYPETPFSVKVLIPDLNYRSEPSMDGKVKGHTGIGTFTIVEVQNGWGRLKSGIGWIWLENSNYCTIGKNVKKEPSSSKTVDEIAKEVISGKWGKGTKRQQKLTASGYSFLQCRRESMSC